MHGPRVIYTCTLFKRKEPAPIEEQEVTTLLTEFVPVKKIFGVKIMFT